MGSKNKSPRKDAAASIPAATSAEAAQLAKALQGGNSSATRTRDGYQDGMETVPDGQPAEVEFTKTAAGKERLVAWAKKQPLLPVKKAGNRANFLPKLMMVLLSTAGMGLFLYRMALQQAMRTQGPYIVYTPSTLMKYRHENGRKILLAILGEVYDVSKSPHYYGVDQGYEFFTGRDASRAFITGKFTEDLNDDIDDFTDDQMKGLVNWKDFFNKEYTYVGRVTGAFFTEEGDATDRLREVLAGNRRAVAAAKERSEKRSEQPGCDMRWSEASGGEVWCSDGLFPRLLTETIGGKTEKRCACFKEFGWSDLRALYKNCSPSAHRCQSSPPKVKQVALDDDIDRKEL